MVFSLLQAMELNAGGVRYPVGGFGTVRDALATACARSGVDVRCGARVARVVADGGVASGVELDSGESISADAVVVNADLPEAERTLMARPRDFDAATYSTSVVALHWALAPGSVLAASELLAHHSLFLGDAATAWGVLDTPSACEAPLPEGSNFYVHNPAVTDPSCAPEGGAAVTVLVPTPPLPDVGDAAAAAAEWPAQARRLVVARLAEALGVTTATVEDGIVAERTVTPQEWRDALGLRRGSVFGMAGGLGQLAVFRPGARHPSTRRLYFTGASARPGNGVPLVMIGSKLCAETVARDVWRVAEQQGERAGGRLGQQRK